MGMVRWFRNRLYYWLFGGRKECKGPTKIMKYYVYIIFNKLTLEPLYVGKGNGTRLYHHYRSAYLNPVTHLQHKIAKMTHEGNMPSQVLMWCENEEEAFIREIHYVAKYGRKDLGLGPLLNKTDGGDGISGARFKRSMENCAKISAIQKGRPGRPVSTEAKIKISKANSGRIFSAESRHKMSLGMKGRIPWNKGKKCKSLSDEHKLKMSITTKGRPWSIERRTRFDTK